MAFALPAERFNHCPSTVMSSVRLRVSAVRYWGDRGGALTMEAARISSLHDSRLPNYFNPVNNPIQLSELTQNGLAVNFPAAGLGLDQFHDEWRSERDLRFREYRASSSIGLGGIRPSSR